VITSLPLIPLLGDSDGLVVDDWKLVLLVHPHRSKNGIKFGYLEPSISRSMRDPLNDLTTQAERL